MTSSVVSGRDRAKFLRRPLRSNTDHILYYRAEEEEEKDGRQRRVVERRLIAEQQAVEEEATVRDRATQTDFRDSECQTDPCTLSVKEKSHRNASLATQMLMDTAVPRMPQISPRQDETKDALCLMDALTFEKGDLPIENEDQMLQVEALAAEGRRAAREARAAAQQDKKIRRREDERRRRMWANEGVKTGLSVVTRGPLLECAERILETRQRLQSALQDNRADKATADRVRQLESALESYFEESSWWERERQRATAARTAAQMARAERNTTIETLRKEKALKHAHKVKTERILGRRKGVALPVVTGRGVLKKRDAGSSPQMTDADFQERMSRLAALDRRLTREMEEIAQSARKGKSYGKSDGSYLPRRVQYDALLETLSSEIREAKLERVKIRDAQFDLTDEEEDSVVNLLTSVTQYRSLDDFVQKVLHNALQDLERDHD